MHLDVYESICFKLWKKYYWTLHFDTSVIDLNLDSRSQECKKTRTHAPIITQSFQLIWMEFGVLLRSVSMMNSLIHSVFKGENPTYMILFLKEKKTL